MGEAAMRGKIRQKPHRDSSENAYLTVFLSLILSIILSLVSALFSAAQASAEQLRSEILLNIAVNSTLGEYNRMLQRQYDLFFIDSTYGGTRAAKNSSIAYNIEQYIRANLTDSSALGMRPKDWIMVEPKSVALDGSRSAAYQNGYPVRQQIYAYMMSGPITEHLGNDFMGAAHISDEALGDVGDMEGMGDLWYGMHEEVEQGFANANTMGEPKDGYPDLNEDGIITEDEKIDVEAGNPLDQVDQICGMPILSQVLGSTDHLSGSGINTDTLLSHRNVNPGKQFNAENTHHYAEANDALLLLYTMEKFGNWRAPKTIGALQYQTEYMIFRNGSDRENLEKMAERLMMIRLTVNTLYLFTDSGRVSEARALAQVLSAIILSPELEELFTEAILLAWAYTESLKDLRTIMAGGRVQFWKDGGGWRTNIWNILTPSTVGAEDQGSGMRYEDYLYIFFLLTGPSRNTYPMMDMMEADVRKASGYDGFRMDACVDELKVTAGFLGHHTEVTVVREASYN